MIFDFSLQFQCTTEEATRLASLIYRVKFCDDKTNLANIPRMLHELAPLDLHQAMSTEEWKLQVSSYYNRDTGKTAEDAKIEFLKLMFKSPTFGSSFFEVKV